MRNRLLPIALFLPLLGLAFAPYGDGPATIKKLKDYLDKIGLRYADHPQNDNAIVVTNERPHPAARNRVPLPNVCEQFGVTYKDTFFMLKALGIRLDAVGQ